MALSRRVWLGIVVAGLACSEGTAPAVPTAMALTSGNNQSALPGVTLALPLTVTVTGSGGVPFPGARVTWAVTTGAANLGSPVDTSDANGVSTTTVTPGIAPGNLVVSATATGVPAVTFQLTTLDPCTVGGAVDTDTVVQAALTSFDCRVLLTGDPNSPFFTDYYRFDLVDQASLQFTMAAAFDTYLEVFFTDGKIMGFNDDADSILTNSKLDMILGAGTYVVAPSSFAANQTGAYALAVAPRAPTLTGCRGEPFLTWITRGVQIDEQIQATDCTTIRAGGGRAFSDRVLIVLSPVRTLSATLTSAAFNPAIDLYQETTTGPSYVAGSVNGAGTATITYAPPGPGGAVFRLEITSLDTVQTGAYRLTVPGPAPLAAGLSAQPARPEAPIRAERRKRGSD